MIIFARYQEWVDGVKWEAEDAAELGRYLKTPSGQKMTRALLNMTLREQAKALTKVNVLPYEAGYVGGQKGMLAAIEALADLNQFSTDGDSGTDHLANP